MKHLLRKEIHLWWVSIDSVSDKVNQMENLLSQDEHERANRFYFTKDRKRFIICRGLLRTLLNQYTEIPSDKIEFNYSYFGKPFLKTEPEIHFNLSHSHKRILYGFSNKPLGVDIEYFRSVSSINSLAKRFFLLSEFEIIEKLPYKEKMQMFYNIWTKKEAFLKAQGVGLNGLDNITVPLFAQKNVTMKDIHGKKWTVKSLNSDTDYIASLASELINPIVYRSVSSVFK